MKIETGTFVVSTNSADIVKIQHDLGEVPNVIAVFPDNSTVSAYSAYGQFGACFIVALDPAVSKEILGLGAYIPKNNTGVNSASIFAQPYFLGSYTLTGNGSGTGVMVYKVTESQFNVRPRHTASTSSTVHFVAGTTYHWLVASVDLSLIKTWYESFGGIAV